MGNEQTIQLDTETTSLAYQEKNERATTMNMFFKITDYSNQGLAFLAGLALTCMMLLVVFNSIKRLFSDPIGGTVEIVSWLGAITAIFSIGYAQLNKGHVYIDMLLGKFPPLLQKSIHTIMNVLSIVFFFVAGWRIILYGIGLREDGVVSETIQFSFYPLVILCSLGFFCLVLAIIKETILIWKGDS